MSNEHYCLITRSLCRDRVCVSGAQCDCFNCQKLWDKGSGAGDQAELDLPVEPGPVVQIAPEAHLTPAQAAEVREILSWLDGFLHAHAPLNGLEAAGDEIDRAKRLLAKAWK